MSNTSMKIQLIRTSIPDESGQTYQLSLKKMPKNAYYIWVRQQKECVGKLELKLQMPDTLIWCEIKIRNDFEPCEKFIVEFMRSGIKQRDKKNYRGRGLGTALLKEVVAIARHTGFKRIYGSVMGDDITRTPNLLKWYRRHGFSMCAPYPGCINSAAAWICMELN